ncbi:hypothetical protein MUY27_08080 [Mucilaginibacter sp. RS28]|uniref:Coproporphyrinogen III oxidase n=1 Tax=Mucilaginibacter straminoryzae TaxID=2932774 RepID=A0A9X1X287_9SPHI|nr:hypothetical protein [Mucilaginibacter straminoryzae]MCJ8209663.1 hypothetical protein [Mucilaginibacter straminoryzae]
MKKHMLKFAIAIALTGSIAAGCSSQKSATTGMDSTGTNMSSGTSGGTGTTSTPDTTKRDTTKQTPEH